MPANYYENSDGLESSAQGPREIRVAALRSVNVRLESSAQGPREIRVVPRGQVNVRFEYSAQSYREMEATLRAMKVNFERPAHFYRKNLISSAEEEEDWVSSIMLQIRSDRLC
ncbi:hypothetical protein NPIL_566111 [Nephila pilipes]|uniref:Uncharacterized protein n=1 Tax=Nephila pilipes TaxID=299642 RepID=A0A8X6R0Z8_NEPPI|nr:hypothetical protein NPIL_566111 [Nephila pilipes]